MRVLPARLSDKPHYVLHPDRALRRLLRGASDPAASERRTVRLRWGLELEVYAAEVIGASILRSGIFDPCVSETLFRLVDRDETAIDAGANVGYMTSILAARAGPGGTVHACEPHPEIGALLGANVARWETHGGTARVLVHDVALSDHDGTGLLAAGPGFASNMGLAALGAEGEATPPGAELYEVALRRVDDLIGDELVGVLKVDVEGHEAAVLRGAERLLAQRRVRDVVFEDHESYPSTATGLVEAAGYRLFSLTNGLFGLDLGPADEHRAPSAWPGPSYLATLEPERALARLLPRGWCLPGIGLRTRRAPAQTA